MSPKTAEEWREYRRINGDKISKNRKRKRMENLESEKLRLMKPLAFEEVPVTAARSVKVEQQSIEACESNDMASVAQVSGGEPEESAQSCRYAMVSGISFFAQGPKQPPLWIVPQPGNTGKTDAQSGRDLDERNCISNAGSGHEIKSGAQLGECARRNSDGEIVAQLREISGKMDRSREAAQEIADRTSAQSGWLALKTSHGLLLFTLVVMIFLAANTFFLVTEQASLYESLGYSFRMALVVALLTEAAFILLSAAASWAAGFWKVFLYAGCLGTGIVIVGLLNSSVDNRALEKMAGSEQAGMLKKEIKTQEALEGTALAIIGNLDADVYPTRISRLKAQLNNPGPEGHTHRLGELREKLASLSASGNVAQEVRVLQWQRWASMGWNVLLAGFLGYLWRRKFSVLEIS